jgi:hypothetical protein
MLQLPLRVLVEAADPDVADALTLQEASQYESVRKKSMTFRRRCQEIFYRCRGSIYAKPSMIVSWQV